MSGKRFFLLILWLILNFNLAWGGELSDKAQFFEDDINQHLSGEGILRYRIDINNPSEYGNLADVPIWTGSLLAAEAFRYTVTKDQDALDKVQKMIEGLHLLQEITGIPGLLARGFRQGTSPSPLESGVWYQGQGKYANYRWKGDISRGEYIGIIFAYGVVNRLLKNTLSAYHLDLLIKDTSALVHYILNCDFYLIDVNGQRTTYGDLNGFYGGILPNPFNCLTTLSIIETALEITGEHRFYRYYKKLRYSYGFYAQFIIWQLFNNSYSNHSDDNLLMISFYNLMQIEHKDSIREYLERGLRNMMKSQEVELNSLFNFIYCSLRGPRADLISQAKDSLKRMPEDRYSYQILQERTRSHHVVPLDLRPPSSYYWKSNPYKTAVKGNRENTKWTGTDYLIAYWMGVYHGFINLSE